MIDNGHNSGFIKNMKVPIVRKAKLVIVDLAGSERVTKSGAGSFQQGLINLLHQLFYCWPGLLLSVVWNRE